MAATQETTTDTDDAIAPASEAAGMGRRTASSEDPAPLWLPRHVDIVVEHAAARPPDDVEGYTLTSRFSAALLGSPWKIAAVASTTLAVVLYLALLPSLLDVGIGSLIKMTFYQAWTLGLMLALSSRVRSISVGTAARYWLAGLFTVAVLSSLLGRFVIDLNDASQLWVTPAFEELFKLAPIAVAVIMGRKVWRHPGLSDLMILGFALGAGYAFHEEALWERAAMSGIGFDGGLVVPSIFSASGLTVAGQAVWTSLLALAVGLVLLHRTNPFAVSAAAAIPVIVVADHMAANAGDELDVARQLLLNGRLVVVLFVVGFAAAVFVDRRRLRMIARRDHLFPEHHAALFDDDADADPLQPILASRYRRLRNGMHTTAGATTQQWPPRSEAHPAPIAELAQLGRAADIAVGPGTSSSGWVPDPDNPGGHRFVGHSGFTVYAASDQIVAAPVPNAPVGSLDDPDLDDAARAALAAQIAAYEQARSAADRIGQTTTSLSVPRARPEAVGVASDERKSDFWQYVALSVVGVGLYCGVRLLTAGDASSVILESPISLAHAPTTPALIVGVLGAIAAAVSLRGRNAAELNRGWEVGPGQDPSPSRPDECEA